jgi:quercetin dioxygenase-like cupin family protein
VKVHSSDSIEPVLVDHGEGVSIRWVINREHGAPNFAMRVIEVPPGSATPYHTHWNEHEVYVLQGTGAVKSPEGDKPLAVGDVVYVAPDEEHQFVNSGTEPFKFICVIPLDQKK